MLKLIFFSPVSKALQFDFSGGQLSLMTNMEREDLSARETAQGLSDVSVRLSDKLSYWPHWVKYLAWFLTLVTSAVAGFFTLLDGLSFGKSGQEKWLFSFFVSVFTDITMNQPVKVKSLRNF